MISRLDDGPDPEAAELVEELINRLQWGESGEAFIADHPAHAETLRRVLPAVQLLADLSRSEGERAAPAGAPAEGVLGDFRIIREVGRGGMGIVYEAVQISLGRRVALKVLPFATTMDPRHIQRFHAEARAAAMLHHPHIVPVYGVGCERGVHYYAMQFIDGQSLAETLAGLRRDADGGAAAARAAAATTLPGFGGREYWRAVARLGLQAAEALEYAHATGVVHRDVKPGNLLIDARGELWVADFGLAKLDASPALTQTGALMGTLTYMSPEQAQARHNLVDHRTDIYALGATLYEMLTLRPVAEGADRAQVLRRVAEEAPVPPRRLRRSVPAELETVVLKCLRKDPADRYASAGELAEDLRGWLEGRPVKAKPPSAAQRLGWWARRHRPAVAAAAVCLLVLFAALGGSAGWVARDAAAKRDAAHREADAAAAEGEAYAGQGDWVGAWAAARRAEAALQSAGGDGPSARRVRALLADLEMVQRLERVRLGQSDIREARRIAAATDAAYRIAFLEYGANVENLPRAEAARRLGSRPVRAALAAALDDWAMARRKARDGDEAGWRQLLELARDIDPDPWRDRLRAALAAMDRDALEELARSTEAGQLPPATLVPLGRALAEVGATERAVELLRAAQRRHHGDFWVNHTLGSHLPTGSDEAVRFLSAAAAARPQSPGALLSLGLALKERGDLDEAIAVYQQAIRLAPDYAAAHNNLGVARLDKGDIAGAIAEYCEAIRIEPGYAHPHYNLGIALSMRGDIDGAIAAYREAIRIETGYAEAHVNLGLLLADRGDLDGAVREYRAAIRARPDFGVAHNNLGSTLAARGDLAAAAAAFREAARARPAFAVAHYNLAITLADLGDLKGAEASCREAIRLRPDHAEAHCNLGSFLQRQGRFAESLESYRRGHALGSGRPGWPFPSGDWVRQAELLAALEPRLGEFRSGAAVPADGSEALAVARLCQLKGFYADAARFYAAAFTADPALTEDPTKQRRYAAACAAVRAATGAGGGPPPGPERERLRAQALEWLRGEIDTWQNWSRTPGGRRDLLRAVTPWPRDPDLAPVRDEAALAELPDPERAAWLLLWRRVDELLENARTAPAAGKGVPTA